MEANKDFKNTVEVRIYFDQKNMELRESFEQKKLDLQNEYNKGERARKDRLCEFKKQLETERRASVDAHQQKLREVNRQFSVDRLELENERQVAYAKAKALQDGGVTAGSAE